MNKINRWRFFIIGILLITSFILSHYNIKYKNFLISYIFIFLQLLYILFLLVRPENIMESTRVLNNNNLITKDRYKKFKFWLTLTTMLLQLCYLFYLYFFYNKEGLAQHFFLVSLVLGVLLILFDIVTKQKVMKK